MVLVFLTNFLKWGGRDLFLGYSLIVIKYTLRYFIYVYIRICAHTQLNVYINAYSLYTDTYTDKIYIHRNIN